MEIISIKPVEENDSEWIKTLLEKRWGSINIVARSKIVNAARIPRFKAILNGENVGLITYLIDNGNCEIVTLDSLLKGKGVGSRLIEEIIKIAKDHKCKRVWLITTNDNIKAQEFYKKRGFSVVAIHKNAMEQSRKLKPKIPLIGKNGIPIEDEVEMEIRLKTQNRF